MEKIHIFVLMIVLFLLPLTAVHADQSQDGPKTRIGVVQLASGDDPQFEAVAYHISRMMEQTLLLLGNYDVVQLESQFVPAGGEPSMDALPERYQNLDFLLFGSVQQSQAAGIEIRVGVFSRAENEIVHQHSETIGSVFELFDAAEITIIALLESFSGEVIRFGSLRIQNSGEQAPYQVFVDGTMVGENITELQLLAGLREITVVQQRLEGEHVVHTEILQVQDGQSGVLSFALPQLLPAERELLEGQIEKIRSLQGRALTARRISRLLDTTLALFEGVYLSPALDAYYQQLLQLQQEHQLYIEEHGDDPVLSLGVMMNPAGGIMVENNDFRPNENDSAYSSTVGLNFVYRRNSHLDLRASVTYGKFKGSVIDGSDNTATALIRQVELLLAAQPRIDIWKIQLYGILGFQVSALSWFDFGTYWDGTSHELETITSGPTPGPTLGLGLGFDVWRLRITAEFMATFMSIGLGYTDGYKYTFDVMRNGLNFGVAYYF